MFGHFLYLIVVLLIYTTYQPTDALPLSAAEAFAAFCLITTGFFAVCRYRFNRLRMRARSADLPILDYHLSSLQTQMSITAIVIFAIDIYGLHLPSYASGWALFEWFPTALAMIFLLLFLGHMAIIWGFAHRVRAVVDPADDSVGHTIWSHSALSVPVLLPWLFLSGAADILQLLPLPSLNRFINTPGGEFAYFLVFLLLVAVFSPYLIQRFWRCVPMADDVKRQRIEALSRRAGVRFAEILYWPVFGGRMLTAGVMGLVSRFRYLLVTPSLLQLLSPEETDAVVAHEIGHVKRRHLPFYLLFFTGYLLVGYAVFDIIIFAILYASPVYDFTNAIGLAPSTAVSGTFSVVIILIFLLYFRFIFGFFMRNFERQADLYAYSLLPNAEPLIRTLGKIAVTSGQSPDKPNWHHFSIAQRIRYLRLCEADRRWIDLHERKVRRAIWIFLAGLTVAAVAAYNLHFGNAGRRLNAHFIETILSRELQQHPENAALHGMWGDFLLDQKQYAEAISAYESGIRLAPEDARILNNLAWLYATSGDPRYRQPDRALRLAKRAAALSQAPHILDTLAEAYFVNGDTANAVKFEKMALAGAAANRDYYRDQLKRFNAAHRHPASADNR